MKLLLYNKFEHHSQPLISKKLFLKRFVRHLNIGLIIIGGSLTIGILGYHIFEELSWIDSLLNASMILGGMGPVDQIKTDAGKIFASFYALFSGVVFLVVVGVILPLSFTGSCINYTWTKVTKKNKNLSLRFFIPLMVLLAVFCGVIDFNSQEVQSSVLVVLISSMLCGFLNTQYSWLSAVVIGSGIMITNIIGTGLGFHPVDQIHPNVFAGLLAMIPSAIGTITGIFFKRIFISISA